MAVAQCPGTSWCPVADGCKIEPAICSRVALPSDPGTSAGNVRLWAALIASAVLLAAIGTFVHGPAAIGLIVVLMAANAALMVIKFMHLDSEPDFLKWLMVGAATVLIVLLVALVPDIVLVFGRKGV